MLLPSVSRAGLRASAACSNPKFLQDQHIKTAYACYFLLGSGILAPWNAFITGGWVVGWAALSGKELEDRLAHPACCTHQRYEPLLKADRPVMS